MIVYNISIFDKIDLNSIHFSQNLWINSGRITDNNYFNTLDNLRDESRKVVNNLNRKIKYEYEQYKRLYNE